MPHHNIYAENAHETFRFPSDEEIALAHNNLRALSPQMAAIIDRAEHRRSEPYIPPKPSRRQVAGETIRVVAPRLLVGALAVFGTTYALWGDVPIQPTAQERIGSSHAIELTSSPFAPGVPAISSFEVTK